MGDGFPGVFVRDFDEELAKRNLEDTDEYARRDADETLERRAWGDAWHRWRARKATAKAESAEKLAAKHRATAASHQSKLSSSQNTGGGEETA